MWLVCVVWRLPKNIAPIEKLLMAVLTTVIVSPPIVTDPLV